MVSLFRLEQKEIEDKFRDEFISLYDLFIKLNGEKFVFNKFEYGLFLIDRFNSLNSEELQYCAFWEPQTPFINCPFKHVDSKELKDEIKYLIKNGKFKRQRASRKIMLRKESFSRWKTYNGGIKNLIKPETTDTEKDSIIAQLQSENAELQTRIAELEDLMSSNVEQQPPVDSKPTLQGTKYNTIERETHLLIIGALANLLANPNKNKTRYVKGAGAINQSALNSDIGAEIASLLQPETKSRSEETIKQRVREALNLITKAE